MGFSTLKTCVPQCARVCQSSSIDLRYFAFQKANRLSGNVVSLDQFSAGKPATSASGICWTAVEAENLAAEWVSRCFSTPKD